MSAASEILARRMRLPQPRTTRRRLRSRSARADGRRASSWPTAGSRARRRATPADGARALPLRPQGSLRAAVRQAARRARPSGRGPERARDVRLGGELQPVRRARRRSGDALLDTPPALASRADRDARPELHGARAVGGRLGGRGRPGGARDPGQRVAVPRPDVRRRRPLARDGRIVDGARGGAGAPLRAGRDGPCDPPPSGRRLPSFRSASSTCARRAPRSAWFREALASPEREDAYWVARDFAAGVGRVAAPVQLIGGWYDIFLPWMLEDFAALRGAGRRPQLVIGPWTHTAPGLMSDGPQGRARVAARAPARRRADAAAPRRCASTSPVSARAAAGGSWRTGRRRAPASWTLWLGGEGSLRDAAPAAQGRPARSATLYDPSDPTPSLGGPVLLAREPVVDNRPLEARADVLTYTTAPLPSASRRSDRCASRSGSARARSSSTCSRASATSTASGVSRNVCDALAARRPRPLRDRRRRRHAGRVRPLADRPPLRRRPPHPAAGLLGGAPALRAQPGHRRGAERCHRAAPGRGRGAPRRRAPSARAVVAGWPAPPARAQPRRGSSRPLDRPQVLVVELDARGGHDRIDLLGRAEADYRAVDRRIAQRPGHRHRARAWRRGARRPPRARSTSRGSRDSAGSLEALVARASRPREAARPARASSRPVSSPEPIGE